MNPTRIAIIGSSGSLGRLLSSSLQQYFPEAEILKLSRNEGWTGFTRFDPFRDSLESLGKLDLLVNAAGIIRESAPAEFEKVHIRLVETILSQRASAGNPFWLQVSALGADPLHKTAFLSTKGIGDQKVMSDGRAAVIRPSVVCFPDGLMVQKLKQLASLARFFLYHIPLPQKMLSTTIQPVMPEDVAAVVNQIIKNEICEVMNITGPDPLKIQDLIRMVHMEGNSPVPVGLPGKIAEFMMLDFMAVWFAGELTPDQATLLLEDNTADYARIMALIGRKPVSTIPFWVETLAKD